MRHARNVSFLGRATPDRDGPRVHCNPRRECRGAGAADAADLRCCGVSRFDLPTPYNENASERNEVFDALISGNLAVPAVSAGNDRISPATPAAGLDHPTAATAIRLRTRKPLGRQSSPSAEQTSRTADNGGPRRASRPSRSER
jgi:hypothetical protein